MVINSILGNSKNNNHSSGNYNKHGNSSPLAKVIVFEISNNSIIVQE